MHTSIALCACKFPINKILIKNILKKYPRGIKKIYSFSIQNQIKDFSIKPPSKNHVKQTDKFFCKKKKKKEVEQDIKAN